MLHESSALGSGGVGDRAGVWVASAAGHAGNDGSALGEGQRVQARSGLPQRLHTHQKVDIGQKYLCVLALAEEKVAGWFRGSFATFHGACDESQSYKTCSS